MSIEELDACARIPPVSLSRHPPACVSFSQAFSRREINFCSIGCGIPLSIGGGLLGGVDDKDFDRGLGGLELKTELLLDGGEDGWAADEW